MKTKIEVFHINDGLQPKFDIHLYCGRPRSFYPKGLINAGMGNPFQMKDQTEAERDRVCDEYAEWINSQGADKRAHKVIKRITQRVHEGKAVALYCFCAPKRCHCDTIKLIVLEQLEYFTQHQ